MSLFLQSLKDRQHIVDLLGRVARTQCVCTPLLHVARSVVRVTVWSTRVSCAKTAEPIEMPFGGRLAWAQGTV